MKEQLISFETAKLAKEKGYDIPVSNFYQINGELWKEYRKKIPNSNYNAYPKNPQSKLFYKYGYSAPTQSLLQTWIRDKHNIHIQIHISNLNRYFYKILQTDINNISNVLFWVEQITSSNKYNKYEEALEAGLQEALKLIES